MKKVIVLCFVILMSAFLLSACIVINNNGKDDTTTATTTEEATTAAAGEETAGDEAQTTAAGADNVTASASTTKAASTTVKPSVAINTTKPTVATTAAPVSGCIGWPSNSITKLVPKPTFGQVFSSDVDSNEATVIIKNCTVDTNKDYVKALKAAGFNNIKEDMYTSFKALNSDGVTVEYVPYPLNWPLDKTYSTLIITLP